MLLKENMISEELVENMNSWKHSGFSVHCGKPINADDIDSRKTLSEYISRAPFSLERMGFNEGSDTVLYRGEHFHPTLARNFDVAGPLEWIARITAPLLGKFTGKQAIHSSVLSAVAPQCPVPNTADIIWISRKRRRIGSDFDVPEQETFVVCSNGHSAVDYSDCCSGSGSIYAETT